MKKREEVIEFIKDQFNLGIYALPLPKEKRTGKTREHYGMVEISDLIDFIYGEPDESKPK